MKYAFALLVVSISLFFMQVSEAGLSRHTIRCYEPMPPVCVNFDHTYQNDRLFQNCREELNSYFLAVEQYQKCLVDAVNRKIQDMDRETQSRVDRFNCKAEGNTLCF